MKNYFNIKDLEPEKIIYIKIKPRYHGILIYKIERIAKNANNRKNRGI